VNEIETEQEQALQHNTPTGPFFARAICAAGKEQPAHHIQHIEAAIKPQKITEIFGCFGRFFWPL
jgi:predicted nucleic acid-binding Zn finger protein